MAVNVDAATLELPLAHSLTHSPTHSPTHSLTLSLALSPAIVAVSIQHRADPETPVEEVAATLKELVAEGKIRYVGLSECTGEELRRFHAVHPVSAVEMEWSLHTRDAESEVIPVARELGVGIVAYSPLGRGLLSSTIKSLDDLDAKDWRRYVCGRAQ